MITSTFFMSRTRRQSVTSRISGVILRLELFFRRFQMRRVKVADGDDVDLPGVTKSAQIAHAHPATTDERDIDFLTRRNGRPGRLVGGFCPDRGDVEGGKACARHADARRSLNGFRRQFAARQRGFAAHNSGCTSSYRLLKAVGFHLKPNLAQDVRRSLTFLLAIGVGDSPSPRVRFYHDALASLDVVARRLL